MLKGEYPNCIVKLCDFELARVLTPPNEIREILGTPDYVGEYYQTKLYILLIIKITIPSAGKLDEIHINLAK